MRTGYYLTPEGARKIKEVMASQRINQSKLGFKVQKRQGTISSLLLGRQGTTADNYHQLYTALGSDSRLTFLTQSPDERYLSYKRIYQNYKPEIHEEYKPLVGKFQVSQEPLSLYFQKLESMYRNCVDVDNKIRIVRSLDALVLNLEQGGK